MYVVNWKRKKTIANRSSCNLNVRQICADANKFVDLSWWFSSHVFHKSDFYNISRLKILYNIFLLWQTSHNSFHYLTTEWYPWICRRHKFVVAHCTYVLPCLCVMHLKDVLVCFVSIGNCVPVAGFCLYIAWMWWLRKLIILSIIR